MATTSAEAAQTKTRSFRFYKWTTVALLFLLGMINFADKSVIGFAAAPIMKDLGLSHEQFGFVGSAFFWFYSIAAIVVGRQSDRFGTKPLLAGIAFLWAIMQFATMFVVNFAQLAATRIVLGTAEGPSFNLSMHATAKWLPPSQRGFGFSLVSIGSALGPAVAAPVLLYFIFHFGWRSAFLLLGAIGVVWILAWSLLFKEDPQVAGVDSKDEPVNQSKREVVPWRTLFPAIFSRDFLAVAFAGFTAYWGLALLIVWVPDYLQQVRHLTHGQAQYIEGLPWLAGAGASLFFTFIADWLYRRTQSSRKSRVYMMGVLGVLSAICWWVAVILPSTGPAIALIVIGSAFASPGYPLGNAIVSDMVLPEHRGTMLGILVGVATSAGIISPAVSGMLIQSGSNQSGFVHAFILLAALNIIANILLLIAAHPPRPGSTPKYAMKN